MGKLSEDLRKGLGERGRAFTCGYDIGNGRRVMEDSVTTCTVGSGTMTFEEGLCWLECLELTPEQAAWLVDAPHVRQLLIDALAVVVGWAWSLNEMRGHTPDDVSQYPVQTAARLIDGARPRNRGIGRTTT